MLEIKNKIEGNQHIKIAEFRKDIRRTAPHKHNSYFEFILLLQGGGHHTIDGKRYPVVPPVFFTVRKEQVHHWELDGEPGGYVLILKKGFVDNSIDKALKDLLTKVSIYNCLAVKDSGPITALFQLLLAEYTKDSALNAAFTEGLLKALLAQLLLQSEPVDRASKHTTDIFLRFEELLSDSGALRNSVGHYARLLNTTPQNLNAICRKAAGLPATSVLAEQVIAEAKRLLLYTDMHINEISTQLHFKDGSHFIKYFKRHTGHTPHTFRWMDGDQPHRINIVTDLRDSMP